MNTNISINPTQMGYCKHVGNWTFCPLKFRAMTRIWVTFRTLNLLIRHLRRDAGMSTQSNEEWICCRALSRLITFWFQPYDFTSYRKLPKTKTPCRPCPPMPSHALPCPALHSLRSGQQMHGTNMRPFGTVSAGCRKLGKRAAKRSKCEAKAPMAQRGQDSVAKSLHLQWP